MMKKYICIFVLLSFVGCNRQSVKTNERYGEYVEESCFADKRRRN